MMSPSDSLATQVLNAFRRLHYSFIIERQTKLQVPTESSACGKNLHLELVKNEFSAIVSTKEMENKQFHSTYSKLHHIQSCIAFHAIKVGQEMKTMFRHLQ
jgi:hypothetical protein